MTEMFIPLVRFIHVAAAVVWVGGMIFFAFFLNPALKRCVGDRERLLILTRTARGFKTGAWIAIPLLIVTGALNLLEVYMEGKLSSPVYRVHLGYKLSLAGLAIILAFLHDFFLGPAYARRVEAGGDPGKLRALTLWIARANLLIVLLVLFFAELLAHGT